MAWICTRRPAKTISTTVTRMPATLRRRLGLPRRNGRRSGGSGGRPPEPPEPPEPRPPPEPPDPRPGGGDERGRRGGGDSRAERRASPPPGRRSRGAGPRAGRGEEPGRRGSRERPPREGLNPASARTPCCGRAAARRVRARPPGRIPPAASPVARLRLGPGARQPRRGTALVAGDAALVEVQEQGGLTLLHPHLLGLVGDALG